MHEIGCNFGALVISSKTWKGSTVSAWVIIARYVNTWPIQRQSVLIYIQCVVSVQCAYDWLLSRS